MLEFNIEAFPKILTTVDVIIIIDGGQNPGIYREQYMYLYGFLIKLYIGFHVQYDDIWMGVHDCSGFQCSSKVGLYVKNLRLESDSNSK